MLDKDAAISKIHSHLVAVARKLGKNAAHLRHDEVLLHAGVLDSSGILELIFWIESEFGVEFDQEELSVDNFGSILQIVDFIARKQG